MEFRTEGAVKVVTGFGPGRYESVQLRVWRRGGRIKARLVGTYRIYCGQGNEHLVEIDETAVAYQGDLGGVEQLIDNVEWALEMMPVSVAGRTKIDMLLDTLIEHALEDWTDPCQADASIASAIAWGSGSTARSWAIFGRAARAYRS